MIFQPFKWHFDIKWYKFEKRGTNVFQIYPNAIHFNPPQFCPSLSLLSFPVFCSSSSIVLSRYFVISVNSMSTWSMLKLPKIAWASPFNIIHQASPNRSYCISETTPGKNPIHYATSRTYYNINNHKIGFRFREITSNESFVSSYGRTCFRIATYISELWKGGNYVKKKVSFKHWSSELHSLGNCLWLCMVTKVKTYDCVFISEAYIYWTSRPVNQVLFPPLALLFYKKNVHTVVCFNSMVQFVHRGPKLNSFYCPL